jgi:hypothetical protein
LNLNFSGVQLIAHSLYGLSHPSSFNTNSNNNNNNTRNWLKLKMDGGQAVTIQILFTILTANTGHALRPGFWVMCEKYGRK